MRHLLFGSGTPGDPNGALVHARLAMDAGRYTRVGPCEPNQMSRQEAEALALARIQNAHETARAGAKRRMDTITVL